MLSIVSMRELDGLISDGILGLAPSNQRTEASLFIDELKNSGVIDKRVFSFYIT